jgi:crotonobetainyl-CoA:carnitine CoA-transferase CaiB-like acyl-CoA transferase
MLDVVTALMSYQAGRYMVTGDSPPRSGNRHLTIAPYDTFDTRDGVLVLAVGNDRQWQTLCATFGLAALGAAEAFRTNEGRVVNYAALRRELEPFFRARALEDLVATLRGAGVPCGAVRSVAEVMNDPQILARAMVESVAHPTIGPLSVLGVPVKLSDTPGAVRTPPPRLGEHTRAILSGDLGLSAAEIDRLMASRAVR